MDTNETALAVCAALYRKSPPPEPGRAVTFLLAAPEPAGSWPRAVLYYGGPNEFYDWGSEEFWGSEELTAGFRLKALLHYRSKPS